MIREKKRSFSVSALRKLRASKSAPSGSACSHSAVAVTLKMARSSHSSHKPVMPAIQSSHNSGIPVNQENQRTPRKCPRRPSRTRCSSVSSMQASAP